MGKNLYRPPVLNNPSPFEKFLLLLFLFLLPSQLGRHFWPSWVFINGIRIDYLAPTLYLNDVLVWLLLFLWFERSRHSLKSSACSFISKKRWLFVVPTILLLLNLSFSQNRLITFFSLLRLLEYSLLIVYLKINLRHFQISTINLILSFAVTWASLLGIFQFITQRSLGGLAYWLGERSFSASTPGIALGLYPRLWDLGLGTWDLRLRPYSSFSHPNSLAGFVLVALILLWADKSIFAKLAKATGLATLLLAQSSAVVLVGATLLALHVPRTRRPLHLLVLIGVSFIAFYSLILAINSRSTSFSQRNSLNHSAIRLVRSFPFFGAGLGNFIPAEHKFKTLSFTGTPANYQLAFQPVHNLYLLLASETGLPLLGIILYFTINILIILFRRKDIDLGLAITAILATGLADHYWLTLPQNQRLVCLAISLAWFRLTQRGKIA